MCSFLYAIITRINSVVQVVHCSNSGPVCAREETLVVVVPSSFCCNQSYKYHLGQKITHFHLTLLFLNNMAMNESSKWWHPARQNDLLYFHTALHWISDHTLYPSIETKSMLPLLFSKMVILLLFTHPAHSNFVCYIYVLLILHVHSIFQFYSY